MKITVIGAGTIGSAVAQTLLDHAEVTNVQVCDARARSLQGLHDTVQNPRLRSFQADARDLSVLEPILEGSDCVVGCADPKMNPDLSELCLDLGIHYCDLGSSEEIVEEQLALQKAARKKSVWIVPNCGLDPGLVNILSIHGMQQFDHPEAVFLRVGDVPLHPEPPFNFRIAWSPEKVLDDYTNPVQLIQDGTIQPCEPLSSCETIHFPEPFGAMEAFCTAGGPYTLLHDLTGKVRTLDHKLIRWPGHADQMRFLLALGFGEDRHIDVRTHLTYRDVLVRRMKQRMGGTNFEDAVLMRVLIQGQKDGQARTLVYELAELFDAERGGTAIKRCTSIPIAMVAVLIASQHVTGGGVAPPENVVPHKEYLDRVIAQGLNIKPTWYDGYRDVANPAGA